MNSFEQAIHDHLTKRGLIVLRNGWPDFLVMTKDRTRGYCLEVKQGADKLSNNQKEMHQALAQFGVITHTWKGNSSVKGLRYGQLMTKQELQSALGRVREGVWKLSLDLRQLEMLKGEMEQLASVWSDLDDQNSIARQAMSQEEIERMDRGEFIKRVEELAQSDGLNGTQRNQGGA